MASTITKVSVPAGTFVDLYSATGVSQGTSIEVETSYNSKIFLIVSESQPLSLDDNPYQLLLRGESAQSEGDEEGIFAFSYSDAYINVIVE